MRRHLLAAAVLLAAGLLSVPPRQADACAIADPEWARTSTRNEQALIVFDAATRTEHFVRSTEFDTTATDFGFLVPTPAQPELFDASADLFTELADITKRRTEKRTRWKELNFACGPGADQVFSRIGSAIAPAGVSEPPVRVVEQKRVGDLLGTVLLASDAKSLREWLTAHGYAVKPELEGWLANYTAGGWYVTAFQIAADVPKGNKAGVTTAAVRLTFRTDRPFYPYREPASKQAETGGQRGLRVWVLADERVGGTVGEAKAWPAETTWANKLPAERSAKVAERGKLPAEVGGRGWHLTEFFDHSSPRPGTDELYFSRAADQGNVEVPPEVVWEVIDPWPWLFGSVAVLAAGLLVLRVLRRKK